MNLPDILRKVLDAVAPPAGSTSEPMNARVAAAVLLLELAQRDGEFSSPEKAAISRLLQDRFQLSVEARDALLKSASASSAELVQLHPYTNVIAQLPVEQRIELIEMLWEVAYADGTLDPEEDALIRRLGDLFHIDDRERVLARQRVLRKSQVSKQ